MKFRIVKETYKTGKIIYNLEGQYSKEWDFLGKFGSFEAALQGLNERVEGYNNVTPISTEVVHTITA